MIMTFVLMLVVTVDVILRKISHFYIPGSNEIVEMGMVVLIFLGIAGLQVTKGHVRVTMFVDKFPYRAKKITLAIVETVEVIVMAEVTYAALQKSISMFHKGLSTTVLHWQEWPFGVCMFIGLLLFTILLAMDTIITYREIGLPPEEGNSSVSEDQGAPVATM